MPSTWCSRFAPGARPPAKGQGDGDAEPCLSSVPEFAVAPSEPIRLPKPKPVARPVRRVRAPRGKRACPPTEEERPVEVEADSKRLQGQPLPPIEQAPEECLFVVRRMNQLGYEAAEMLSEHFAAFGEVLRVQAAFSARRRPSSFGFVEMATAEAVSKVLELGEEQLVGKTTILVQKFERQRTEKPVEETVACAQMRRSASTDSMGSLVSAETDIPAGSALDSDSDSNADLGCVH